MDIHRNQKTDYGKVEVLWEPQEKPGKPFDREEGPALRVAAYCRVSTDSEEQRHSFEVQEDYYARMITSTPGWIFCGIYADPGRSGTMRTGRPGLQRLIRHCQEGKIDKVLCKSISRFARNTLDLLEIVRALKALEVGVIFEKEGIDTLTVQGEFVLSAVAAIAQEESRSISENMSWSFTTRFQRGIPVFKCIYGYRAAGKGADRVICVHEEEAKVVREIYRLALKEEGDLAIARHLMKRGYQTAAGRREWTVDMVKGILRNERYTGNVLCQKTYTQNYLTHKTVENLGDRQQYYIENHHPAIISQETYHKVREIRENRRRGAKRERKAYPLSGRLICGECGGVYHRRGGGKNPRWGCWRRRLSQDLCRSAPVGEDRVLQAVLKALEEKYGAWNQTVLLRMKRDLKRMKERDFIEHNRLVWMGRLAKAKGKKRLGMETAFQEQEAFWALLEQDVKLRDMSLRWLEGMPRGEKRLKRFRSEAGLPYLRAWAIRVTVLSPRQFQILWLDQSDTIVEIDEDRRGSGKDER